MGEHTPMTNGSAESIRVQVINGSLLLPLSSCFNQS
jgi:hypothetical protein